jgi:hypothetical protein
MSDLKFSKIMTAESFYEEIDAMVSAHDLSYMDAVVHFCEKNEIEIEVAASMIAENFRIKSMMQQEGEQLNFLPKTAKLPI